MSQQHLSFRVLPSGDVDRLCPAPPWGQEPDSTEVTDIDARSRENPRASSNSDDLASDLAIQGCHRAMVSQSSADLGRSGLKCSCHGLEKEGLFGLHRLRRADASVYIGEWLNGLEHGDGRWHDLNRGTYEGSWCAGRFHGHGLFIFPDGEWFDGTQ